MRDDGGLRQHREASAGDGPSAELIGSDELSEAAVGGDQGSHVEQGGKRIIQLRGRSSFQSPSHQSLMMVKAAIDGKGYPWPCGVYVDSPGDRMEKTVMAMETTIGDDGVVWEMPRGTDDEMAALRRSYDHLVKLRDEVIEMGVIPPTDQWSSLNPNL